MQMFRRLLGEVLYIMKTQPELVTVILATIAAVIFNSKFSHSKKSYKPNPPRSIFESIRSPVYEFKNGELDNARQLVEDQDVEISFVMYYASWDGLSAETAVEFATVASQLSDQVMFVAIECWWTQGNCRQNYLVHRFPFLVAYVGNSWNGIHYRGVLRASYMLQFLQRILHPLTYITDSQSLNDTLEKHENVVVGYFDAGSFPKVPGYRAFLRASISKNSRAHLVHPVQFAVVTNRAMASLVGLQRPGSIAFHRQLNCTLILDSKSNISSKEIVFWVGKHFNQHVRWLFPSGVKSLQFNRLLGYQPGVIMFTSFKDGYTDSYRMFHGLAMHYHGCGKESPKRACPGVYPSETQCQSFLVSGSLVQRTTCEVCLMHQAQSSHRARTDSYHQRENFYEPRSSSFYGQSRPLFGVDHGSTLLGDFVEPEDWFEGCQTSTSHLTLFTYRRCCRQDKLLNGDHPQPLTPGGDPAGPGSSAIRDTTAGSLFSGLGCATNRTVGFYAMDSDQYWWLAQRLGVTARNPGRGALVLVDVQDETTYVLDQVRAITRGHIEEFVLNYTDGVLTRHLRTSPQPAHQCAPGSQVCVKEVTSVNFNEIVLDPYKDVVLLYYAPWCAVCTAIMHTYLGVAKAFQSQGNILFTRINGDANDLPWELTASVYPTILFFPAGHKSWSARFSADFNLFSEINLADFVLSHATKRLKNVSIFWFCSTANAKEAKIDVAIWFIKTTTTWKTNFNKILFTSNATTFKFFMNIIQSILRAYFIILVYQLL